MNIVLDFALRGPTTVKNAVSEQAAITMGVFEPARRRWTVFRHPVHFFAIRSKSINVSEFTVTTKLPADVKNAEDLNLDETDETEQCKRKVTTSICALEPCLIFSERQ